VPAGALGARIVLGEIDPEHIGGPLYAGFLCGALFAFLARTASGRHRLDQLSYLRAAALGALAGAIVGTLPFVLGDQKASERPVWVLPLAISAALAAASAISAVVARWISRQNSLYPAA
jgi:hypothetical protein